MCIRDRYVVGLCLYTSLQVKVKSKLITIKCCKQRKDEHSKQLECKLTSGENTMWVPLLLRRDSDRKSQCVRQKTDITHSLTCHWLTGCNSLITSMHLSLKNDWHVSTYKIHKNSHLRSTICFKINSAIPCITPVSYTHLDVYKRQGHSNAYIYYISL